MKKWFKIKNADLKDIKTITGSSLLIALCVILDFFRLVVSSLLEISFSFLALVMVGMLYGPISGALAGGIADILQYIIRPSGEFFIGFTLNSILAGAIYGFFLYNKKITIKRISLCVLVEGVIITLLLTPIWLNILYGAKIFALPRIIKFFLMFPIKVALISGCAKVLEKQKLIKKITV